MKVLLHVVIKDHENSGYVWDEFYCPDCLCRMVKANNCLEVLSQTIATPRYLSGLYPQLVNEPVCDKCGLIFQW
jgi:hypothetical protein